MIKRNLTIQEVYVMVRALAERIRTRCPEEVPKVYGIPRGGVPVALALSAEMICTVVDDVAEADVIVDDIICTGRTMSRYTCGSKRRVHAFALIPEPSPGVWYVFPWERAEGGTDTSAVDAVVRQLEYIGEDPERDGLVDTPHRVVRAWDEMFSGYAENPKTILGRVFENDGKYDQMVVLKDIEYFSCCEHHLLPFFGRAHIAYLPDSKIVGISKLSRLVNCFARRAQVQERLTQQVADAIMDTLHPLGCGVVVTGQHLCMMARGVKQGEAVMRTSAVEGVFRTDPTVRGEFFAMLGRM